MINSISAMIKAAENKPEVINNYDNNQFIDISYDEGVKYFGSMMERIMSSIDKIESNFAKISAEN